MAKICVLRGQKYSTQSHFFKLALGDL